MHHKRKQKRPRWVNSPGRGFVVYEKNDSLNI
nr:MAG TPA: hypothetical protein [Caudoviricetes sp.]